MKHSLRYQFLGSFLFIIVVIGVVTTWVGIQLIGEGILRQAQDHVRNDLNSAREVYRENLGKIRDVVRLTADRIFLRQGLTDRNLKTIRTELKKVQENESFDILNLTDIDGTVLIRTRNPEINGDSHAGNPIIKRVITENEVIASTHIIPFDELVIENRDLIDQSRIELTRTPKAFQGAEKEMNAAMMLVAAAPVMGNDKNIVGVLYGGQVINRNYEIVDKVKETVYQGQTYKGKDIGTATIFQGGIRISTNVMREDGSRAIGTSVSQEVYNQVLINGLPWIERAFVVNDWYIAAYEPIKNITGEIIGILYVGVLEEKFVDLKNKTRLIFFGITLAGVLAALTISYFLTQQLTNPIRYLVSATQRFADGNFSQKVHIQSKNEIRELGEAFNYMTTALKERDEKLKKYAQQKIMESERLATIGQLAAGVAHELNNPLGGILVFGHLLLEKMEKKDPLRDHIEKIVQQTTRCKEIVKGLLDFSRQTEPQMILTDIHDVLNSALSLLENQTLFQNIRLHKYFLPSPPRVTIDSSQIQQVFINLILNGVEAMEGQGDLTIRTDVSEDGKFFVTQFTDTGCGIPEEHIERLFEPFFTTKEVGKGTGLGLSVSYGIIQRHHGTIDVKSKPGKGTTFIIRLPLTPENNK